jgi:hypothetical protein
MKTKDKSILVKAFKTLTRDQKANLKWHVNEGTPICCGQTADRLIDGSGGG